jgi:peptide/nickel transport system permease protein
VPRVLCHYHARIPSCRGDYMRKYVLRKIFASILTIVLVMTLNFLLIHLAPGDPVSVLMGPDSNDPEMRAAMMAKYGLDKPLFLQYLNYIADLFRGNLGTSIIFGRPVAQMILEKIVPTLSLVVTASIAGLVLGTLMGIWAARNEGSLLDTILSSLVYVLNAVPSFWLALMLIMMFATKFRLLPSSGLFDPRANYAGLKLYLDMGKHMILPLVTLILLRIPHYFRTTKTSILQVSAEDYINTFRATGMNENKIFRKYVFRNAILPVVTSFGLSIAYLITGVALVETVFAWPGTGRVTMTAINQRDYPTLMGMYLIMSIMVAVTMVIMDIVYAMLDPRIRY